MWNAAWSRIPDGISFERATLVEPLNTCLKAVVQCDPQPDDFVVVMGQGPIGLMFTMLVNRTGARVAATDTIAERLRPGRALRRGRMPGIRARPMSPREVKPPHRAGAAPTW